MSIVVFTDLDDTLFQTRRKLRGDEGSLTSATLDTAGQPHSFCTPPQQALLAHFFASNMTVIPVTGRDWAAMQRVTLPFTSWRVLDHGATLLRPDGALEPEWSAQVAEQLQLSAEALGRVSDAALALAQDLGCQVRRHHVRGQHRMSVAKHPQANAPALAEVQACWESLISGTLHIIANANNVTLMPHAPSKAGAVRFLLQRYFAQADLALGVGDSLSDLGFMNLCHFALTPPQGQLLRAVTAANLVQR